MISEYQLRVLPEQAANEQALKRYISKEKGMDKVLLGCYKDNLASAATIKKNGGVLVDENDNYNEGRISQYYSINL